jgi:hypothetical protein
MFNCEELDWDGGDCDGDAFVVRADCEHHGFVPDYDMGTSLATRTGSTSAAENTVSGTCGGSYGRDHIYLFEAPESGVYTFTTEGSSFNTVLHIIDACSGESVGCDSAGTSSSLVGYISEGTTIFIVVDGFSYYTYGSYRLSITSG